MISFFVNEKDLSRLKNFVLSIDAGNIQTIGEAQWDTRSDNGYSFEIVHYRQVRANLLVSDLLVLKLMFDIKHSLHRSK